MYIIIEKETAQVILITDDQLKVETFFEIQDIDNYIFIEK